MRRAIFAALVLGVTLLIFQTALLLSDPNPTAKVVTVVPNPVRFTETPFLNFNNVPPHAEILIFTVSGDRLDRLVHPESTIGSVSWSTPRAFGIFIFVVQSPGKKQIGKFAIIP